MKIAITSCFVVMTAGRSAAPNGIFETGSDVGKIDLKGSQEFLADKGGEPHRKGCAMVRQSLDENLLNVDGSGQEQLTFGERFADGFPHPSWSPDSRKIAFVSYHHILK